MTAVLVTGMSGVGKSTVLAELARRGHQVVDTDFGGWTLEVRDDDGVVVDHVWDVARMDALLASSASPTPTAYPSARSSLSARSRLSAPSSLFARSSLFVAGCVSNQGRWYPRFSAVALVSVDRETMLRRLASRTGNDYGKSPEEVQRILADVAAVEPLLRASASVELAGTLPIEVLADRLELLVT